MMHEHRQSDDGIVCAGQRSDQEGSCPSDAQMRGVISESGGNASLAGGMKPPEGRVSIERWNPKGMRRSTGPQSKESIQDEPVGQRWGKVEPALWRRRRYSSTHRTKVCAGGTVRKM